MKKLILLSLITISSISFSQTDSTEYKKIEKEIKRLHNDGWIQVALGVFAHGIGTVGLISEPISNPDVYWPFSIFNSIGLGFDTGAIISFTKARNKRKELKKLMQS